MKPSLSIVFAGGVFLLVFTLFALGVVGGYAAEPCGGRLVKASWYGQESGNRTATGERFTGNDLTAAMPLRKYLGQRFRVTYRGRSVVVRVNDLGPAARLGRGIDLSRAAAKRIGLIGAGVGMVCLVRIH